MVFELPAALSLRLIRPGWAYGTAVLLFGVFACCLSSVKTYGALLGIRLLIGLAEAFVQTGWVFLSLWYKHDELSTRTGTPPRTPSPDQNDTNGSIKHSTTSPRPLQGLSVV
jgi:hypothetical protein